MSIQEILTGGGGVLVVVMTLVQFAPHQGESVVLAGPDDWQSHQRGCV